VIPDKDKLSENSTLNYKVKLNSYQKNKKI